MSSGIPAKSMSLPNEPKALADETISELSHAGSPSGWVVLSGPPCAGKTTLLHELKNYGFEVRNEVAEEMRKALIQEMPGSEEPWKMAPAKFTLNVLKEKVARENCADRNQVVIWDRALPDTLPFCERNSVELSDESFKRLKGRYRAALIFEALPFKAADFRDYSDALEQEQLGKKFENIYRALEYDVLRVPKMLIRERVEFVISLLKGLGISGN